VRIIAFRLLVLVVGYPSVTLPYTNSVHFISVSLGFKIQFERARKRKVLLRADGRMAEAHEVYRQFVATPLKLRKKRSPPLPSPPHADHDETPGSVPRPELAPQYLFSTPPASAKKVVQNVTPADVERLEERIEVECRVGDGDSVQQEQPVVAPAEDVPPRRTSSRTRAKAALAAVVPVVAPTLAPPVASVAPRRKQKRVMRSEAVVNASTGGVYVDTPTKASAPPKRSRKSTLRPGHHSNGDAEAYRSDAEKESADVGSLSITRNMMDAFNDIDEALPDPDAMERPTRSKKKPAGRQVKSKTTLPPQDTEKENIETIELVSITRNMMDAFKDTDGSLPDSDVVKSETSNKEPATRHQARAKAKLPGEDKENINVMEPISIARNMMEEFAPMKAALPDSKVLEKPKKTRKQPVVHHQPAAREVNVKSSRPRAPAVKQLRPTHVPARRSHRLVRGKADPVIPQNQQADPVVPIEEPQLMEIADSIEASSPPLAIDVEKAFCGRLLETKTTAGALFALWFNALGYEVEACSREEVNTFVDVLQQLFAVCEAISRCEELARKRAERDEDSDEEKHSAIDKPKKKKTVRFRHFDLSSLNLNYNDDSTVPGFVDDLLRLFVDAVDQVAGLRDRLLHAAQATMITHIIGVLGNTNRLTERTKGEGLVATAFRSMSAFEQAEVRASQPFFSREFTKLVPSASAQPPFLESVFSQLIASLARFRLRELFLPFKPKELLENGEQLQIATYDHQDYGAAIHRALKEIYLYHDLAAPILAAISSSGLQPHDATLIKKVQDQDLDDFNCIERFMLACRYLRLSFRRCILVDSHEDEETAQLREKFEELCALMKRYVTRAYVDHENTSSSRSACTLFLVDCTSRMKPTCFHSYQWRNLCADSSSASRRSLYLKQCSSPSPDSIEVS
jgi:hypothetical protein